MLCSLDGLKTKRIEIRCKKMELVLRLCEDQLKDEESITEALERLNELNEACPHHGIPPSMLVQNFYSGLDFPSQQLLDSSFTLNHSLFEVFRTRVHTSSGCILRSKCRRTCPTS
ncbi:hypothetical protein TanjilG_26966 [Lupinus angustifolius]|uniref:Uncharacterized protein n=1 Tax=Lupinus angustifolius TaxID=3871 RepID=A0A1J7GHB1_LUPAN|nr:hypothetical protein TanjilG_26966 [Lupinus angustifolius]